MKNGTSQALGEPVTGLALRLCLFVHHRNGGMDRFESNGKRMVIGSDPRSDVCLLAREIAPIHASIEVTEGALYLTDGSTAGTLVGDRLVKQQTVRLQPRDVVEIGPYRIRVQVVAAPLPPVIAQVVRTEPSPAAPPSTQAASPPPARLPPPAGSVAAPSSPPPAVQPTPAEGPEIRVGRGREVAVALRRRIHRDLIDNLDLARLERSKMNDHLLRAKVVHALGQIVERYRGEMSADVDTARLVEEIAHEAIGLGPLEQLLADPLITEIMVVDPLTIYVERARRVYQTDVHFTDEESARSVLERIVAPLGRRVDESSPLLDARLHDGSRLNAVVRPLALRGTCITIRKFPSKPLAMDDLIGFGTLTPRMARFLQRTVTVRKNLLISGGTGSGKTTLLNVLSGSIPGHERIVTIEDSAELRLVQPHVVSLESRPANMEGKGEISIRDLVRNAMRMRPDRIIVGECRGGEALDMLQAMNTGHAGSMTTTHANNPPEAVKRIEILALMAGLDVPSRALREQIAAAVEVIVQQSRLSDGTRKIVGIAEVTGLSDEGEIQTREIFGYRQTGSGKNGEVQGEFYATGNLPSFVGDFITRGLCSGSEEVV